MARAIATAATSGVFIRWLLLLVLSIPGLGNTNPAGSVSSLQEYRYVLAVSKEHRVCRHMNGVYNDKFRQPWNYTTSQYPPPWFPPLTAGQQEPKIRFGLSSRFPDSAEFDAIPWKEAVMVDSSTVLVAEFDIDNDGEKDLVLKLPFMDPWRDGANDSVLVVDRDQVDLAKPIDPNDLYFRPAGLRRPALINYMTLGFMGTWIRPFIHEGIAYLSVHRTAPQSIRILKYKGGGGKIGRAPPGVQESFERDLARPWEPLEVEPVCHLRMIPTK